jgi:hypothetical protein
VNGTDNLYQFAKTGATIKGLVNPNSKLGLHEDIQQIIKQSPDARLLFFLGQVDIDFGYYYKCVMDSVKYPIEPYIDDLIERYIKYIKQLPIQSCVITINPTTILDMAHTHHVCFKEDYGVHGLYSSTTNIPYESIRDIYLNDSYESRVSFCKLFNDRLEAASREANIPCINLWDEIVVEGTIRSEYIPHGGDHHLRAEGTWPLRATLLARLHEIFPTDTT